MNQDQFDARMRGLAADYRQPPSTPREEMWERIQAARRERPRRRVQRPVRWVAWAVGLAAVLTIGIAVGRYTASSPSTPDGSPVAVTPEAEDVARSVALEVATARHLRRVETFLTVFRSEAGSGSPRFAAYRDPARELLLTTRLMQSSPAADDAAVRALLDDVELVLAQIAHLSPDDTADELEFIDQGLRQRGVLLKLRSTAAAAGVTAQGEL